MSVPNVTITKISGGTAGAVPTAADGINAIIAAAQKGTQNQPGGYSTQQNALSDFGYGPLVEFAAYDMAVSQKPCVLVRPTATTAGAYSNLTTSGVTGSSAVTTTGTPLDEYAFVQVNVVVGGTIGVAGITYTYSVDSNNTTSGVTALGTANSLTIPNTGVQFNLGAGTLNAGDVWTVYTTRPQMTNADLVTSLESLRTSSQLWENVLIDQDATSTTVNTVDTWLAALEAVGQFHGAFLNSRHKTVPVPGSETEAAFATAMGTAFNSVSSIRLAVGSDAGDVPSLVTGFVQPRPVSLALAGRCGLIPLGEDPAFVSRGNIPSFGIADGKGNPKWHDEQLYPGLDNLRLTTFRTVPGQQGVYLTNGNLLSPSGSSFVFTQHMRTMNRACNIGYASLVQQLGRGVGKKTPDPVTGGVYILEQDATLIETIATNNIRNALKGQVVDAALQLARNDDLSSNSGATIHANIQIEALAYIKSFQVNAMFVKAITVPV